MRDQTYKQDIKNKERRKQLQTKNYSTLIDSH